MNKAIDSPHMNEIWMSFIHSNKYTCKLLAENSMSSVDYYITKVVLKLPGQVWRCMSDYSCGAESLS